MEPFNQHIITMPQNYLSRRDFISCSMANKELSALKIKIEIFFNNHLDSLLINKIEFDNSICNFSFFENTLSFGLKQLSLKHLPFNVFLATNTLERFIMQHQKEINSLSRTVALKKFSINCLNQGEIISAFKLFDGMPHTFTKISLVTVIWNRLKTVSIQTEHLIIIKKHLIEYLCLNNLIIKALNLIKREQEFQLIYILFITEVLIHSGRIEEALTFGRHIRDPVYHKFLVVNPYGLILQRIIDTLININNFKEAWRVILLIDNQIIRDKKILNLAKVSLDKDHYGLSRLIASTLEIYANQVNYQKELDQFFLSIYLGDDVLYKNLEPIFSVEDLSLRTVSLRNMIQTHIKINTLNLKDYAVFLIDEGIPVEVTLEEYLIAEYCYQKKFSYAISLALLLPTHRIRSESLFKILNKIPLNDLNLKKETAMLIDDPTIIEKVMDLRT